MAAGYKTGGRKAGTPNKMTVLLKDAVLQAAAEAHPDGLVGYLKLQATENATPFLSLLGRVIPLQVNGAGENGEIIFKTVYE